MWFFKKKVVEPKFVDINVGYILARVVLRDNTSGNVQFTGYTNQSYLGEHFNTVTARERLDAWREEARKIGTFTMDHGKTFVPFDYLHKIIVLKDEPKIVRKEVVPRSEWNGW